MKRRFLACAALLLVLTACGRTVHTQRAEPEWELVEEKAAVLPDGTAVELWREKTPFYRWSIYRLSDGTELLEEEAAHGPEGVYVGGSASLDELAETAREAISAYYEDQGLHYDLQTELERAYEDYRSCQTSGDAFEAYTASQEVLPTASNGRVICFMTITTRSIRGRLVEQARLGAVFDRETGEKLEPESLFTVPWEEVLERLLNEVPVYDSALRDEIAAAWDPARLEFYPETLEAWFPQGTLPSQETAYGFGVDYEDIRDILQPWAVPEAAA